jgi:uncharacterized protein YbjT (DUF2867 family)
MAHDVFITGGTGYIGRTLIARLLARRHTVRALVRAGSGHKLPHGAIPVTGDALDSTSYAAAVSPADTFVHLVGTPHPSPAKARQFREVDLVSIDAAVDAAVSAHIAHFIYLSVAQPAPTMAAYIAVRSAGETMLRGSGIPSTFVRPWYVLGPGHRWPLLLLPAYWLMERLPSTRAMALRLGLVTLDAIVATLVHAVENPSRDSRIVTVPEIRAHGA